MACVGCMNGLEKTEVLFKANHPDFLLKIK